MFKTWRRERVLRSRLLRLTVWIVLPALALIMVGALVSEKAWHRVSAAASVSGLVALNAVGTSSPSSSDPEPTVDISAPAPAPLASAVAVAQPTSASLVGAAAAPAAAAPVSAGPFGSPTAVGPLFLGGLGQPHGCTASVVASPAGNVIVTAAHCLAGPGTAVVFAPGYANGVAPYGMWNVVAAYGNPAWLNGGDTTADYAFLVVVPSASNPTQASVQSVVGANVLGTQPAASMDVTMSGYPMGTGSSTVVCTRTVIYDGSYPTSTCPGFVGGTSGGPWVTSVGGVSTVTGVVGGLHQGGCNADVTYTAPFTAATLAVYNEAITGAPADSFPTAGSDGC
jgi:V8-like Glu-specific endopeptidase